LTTRVCGTVRFSHTNRPPGSPRDYCQFCCASGVLFCSRRSCCEQNDSPVAHRRVMPAIAGTDTDDRSRPIRRRPPPSRRPIRRRVGQPTSRPGKSGRESLGQHTDWGVPLPRLPLVRQYQARGIYDSSRSAKETLPPGLRQGMQVNGDPRAFYSCSIPHGVEQAFRPEVGCDRCQAL
jgi:hypothetical protein